jgi:hypothetical protein
MRVRAFFLAIAVFFVMIYFHAAPGRAQTSSSLALSGRVSSAEEGQMEGVLVSAKMASSTITITVVSDEQGRYWFLRRSCRRVSMGCAFEPWDTIWTAPTR